MKNTLWDLNLHLFEQIERLNEPDISDDELDREIERTQAMTKISSQIIKNAELVFKAKKHVDEHGLEEKEMPQILIGKK